MVGLDGRNGAFHPRGDDGRPRIDPAAGMFLTTLPLLLPPRGLHHMFIDPHPL